jgi:multiple sugar transport system substrate-binding protein
MRQVDRRSFFRLLGLTTAGVAVAACSSGESATTEGDAAAATTGPLSGTATLTTWGSDAEVAAFNRLAAAFKEQRGADVTIEVLPYDQIRTVIDRRLQANEPPDLFRVSYTDVGSYASNGVLADLTDYLQDGFGDAFLPALWAAVLSPDGAPFGVPHHTDTSALVYNVAHFERAGITEVPTSLETAWTWEQFVDVLRALKAANPDAAPFSFNYQLFGAYRWFNTLYQAGGTLLNDALDAPTLDSAEARKALEWTRSLYTEGLHEPSILVKRPTYPDEIFPTEKISMIQAGDFLLPSLEAAVAGKFEWGVTYLMRDVAAATDLGGNAVVVTAAAQNPNVAAEFAKFLVTRENMQSFCEETTVLPVRTDLVDATLNYAVRPDLMPVFQQQVTTLPESLVRATTSPAFPGINQALVDNMDQYLSDPAASTDDTIQALNDAVQAALQAQS